MTVIPAARPIIGDEERAAVDRVLRSGLLACGPEVAAFEDEFSAAVLDGRPTVALNSAPPSECSPGACSATFAGTRSS